MLPLWAYVQNRWPSGRISTGLFKTGYRPAGLKIDGADYTTGYTYNSYGQLLEKTAPSGFKLLHANKGDDYAPDRQRSVSRHYTGNVLQSTRYYSGDYEKEITGGVTKEFDYIYSPEGLAAIAVKTGGTRTLYYTHTDHLSSLRVITDGNKALTSRYRYDAWGKRTLVAGTNNITNRGFIEHEHLPEFGLINMNARMYDPILGRFLSPDPYVQMPDFTQSYNRYSYCLNNPLIYTDPSGEFFFTAILGPLGAVIDAACWGAVIGGTSYTASVAFSDGGFNNWNWGNFCKSVGIGALSGAVTFEVGQMFGPVGSMGIGGEFTRAYIANTE